MLNKKVSIIIPIYNTKKEYVARCLNSCFNQTYNNIEILIINDGSDINYNDIFEKKDKRIKIFNITNLGVSNARNYGINKSNGYWLFFLDSDDYLNSDSIEKIVNISLESFDIIISSTKINNKQKYFINNNISIFSNKIDLLKCIFNNKYLYKCVDTPWGKLYNKSLIKKNNIKFDSNLIESEDGIFNFQAFYYAKKIFLSNEVLYNYRIHSESICNKYKINQDKNYEYLLEQYSVLINKFCLFELNDELKLFSMRLFCRLLRKFYSKEKNYKNFKLRIYELNDNFKQKILCNEYKNMSFGRKLILFLYKNDCFYLLYIICKLKLKIK